MFTISINVPLFHDYIITLDVNFLNHIIYVSIEVSVGILIQVRKADPGGTRKKTSIVNRNYNKM